MAVKTTATIHSDAADSIFDLARATHRSVAMFVDLSALNANKPDVYTALIFEDDTVNDTFEFEARGETPEDALANVLRIGCQEYPEWLPEPLPKPVAFRPSRRPFAPPSAD